MQRPRQSSLIDWLGLPASLGFITTFGYFLSRKRILWSDELFGWMLAADPSWQHMVTAWKRGADGGGFGFYLLARTWLQIFGHTALAFRMFSIAALLAAFTLMWFTLRRRYRPEVVLVALLAVWFGSRTILFQTTEARFYGLLLAATAWCLSVAVRSAEDTAAGRPARALRLAEIFTANLFLASVHPLGIFYSGLLLVASGVADLTARRWRPMFFAAAVLPWGSLMFSLQAMHNSALVGKPWFWTQTPFAPELGDMYTPVCAPAFAGLALGVLFCLFFLPNTWPATRGNLLSRRDLLLPAVALSLAPVFLWVVSQWGTSIFVDRYLIPFTLGMAILLAEGYTEFFPEPMSRRHPWRSVLATSAALLLLYFPITDATGPFHDKLEVPSKPEVLDQLTDLVPSGMPIVVERVDVFDLLAFYKGTASRNFLYPLDWEVVTAPDALRGEVSGYNEMENWRRVGYFSAHIVDSGTFLRSAQQFAVIDDEHTHWFERRILGQPQWSTRRVAVFNHGFWTATIFVVTRQVPAAGSSRPAVR